MIYSRDNLRLLKMAMLVLTLAAPRVHAQDLGKATTSGKASIEFPKGWTVKGLIATGPEDSDATGSYAPNLSIEAKASDKVDLAKLQERLAKALTNYKSVDAPHAVTINGLQGTVFGGTFTRDAHQLRFCQYFFTLKDQTYFINFICLESRWDFYRPLVEASVATLMLKK